MRSGSKAPRLRPRPAIVGWVAAGLSVGACNETAAPDAVPQDASSEASAPATVASAPPPNPCAAHDDCIYDGRCTPNPEQPEAGQPDACVAASDDDCARSQGCRDWGACTADEGVCRATTRQTCRASWLCRLHGRCTADQGRCVVASDEDCRRSEVCKFEKKCTQRKEYCVR